MSCDELKTITIPDIRQKGCLSYINDDMILFDDLAEMPIPDVPCRMSGIIVGHCLKGVFTYTADTVTQNVEAGSVFIISNGQVISDCKENEGVECIAIMITYDFFQEMVKDVHELSALFLLSRTRPVFELLPGESVNVCNYYRLIKEKVDDKSNHFRKDVVRLLMSAMIYDISNAIYRVQQIRSRREISAERIFTDFIKIVELNFRSERRVTWYSKQLCITPKYLSETVRQISGRTPNEWIDSYVTMELRVLLKNTTKSVKEISCDMNFPNQSFMGKFFKEHVGMSPLAYRKK